MMIHVGCTKLHLRIFRVVYPLTKIMPRNVSEKRRFFRYVYHNKVKEYLDGFSQLPETLNLHYLTLLGN